MSTITLPKGGAIRTFPLPPKGFDPLKAEERLLALYGFPRRPPDPKMAAHWEAIVSRPIGLIEPRFRAMPYTVFPANATGDPGAHNTFPPCIPLRSSFSYPTCLFFSFNYHWRLQTQQPIATEPRSKVAEARNGPLADRTQSRNDTRRGGANPGSSGFKANDEKKRNL